ncbi:SDR family oxidoreductase [Nocardioides sp. 616]|uniref:SDR family oxidoreductase n=1 Tax=Nocardioides sp. 616 TaxID=2268090 RepID=UPI000CE2FCBB|nr:SDR family oxidoreductase [Nocardioides sp. 616]
MGTLEGRVAIVTGAGRGLGRAHALLLAREGARVVVNDLGGSLDGSVDGDQDPAQQVVEEILAAGGTAVADHEDVSSFEGAGRLVARAAETFGGLHVVVNNAGILRDAFLHRMTEAEWDAVIAVHLKGHFALVRQAVAYWQPLAKAGTPVNASVINTTSASGTYLALPGQANYGAAKAAIASFSIVAAAELGRLGVRVNAISPGARTRMTESTPGPIGELMRAPVAPGALDEFSPENVSPLVAYLAAESTTVTGRVFAVRGGEIQEISPWALSPERVLRSDVDWTPQQVAEGFEAVLGVDDLGTPATA